VKVVPFERKHLENLPMDLSHNDDARPFLEMHPDAMAVLEKGAWSMEHEG